MSKFLTNRDVEYAIKQRERGVTWREIGARLAILKQRGVAYQGTSIMRAVRPFMEDA
ncbi:MAG: hypothetical protein JWP08_1914 [Bryobacterales bacterium]|nr:hypothetical protein [Bryobacterales bacterium]